MIPSHVAILKSNECGNSSKKQLQMNTILKQPQHLNAFTPAANPTNIGRGSVHLQYLCLYPSRSLVWSVQKDSAPAQHTNPEPPPSTLFFMRHC